MPSYSCGGEPLPQLSISYPSASHSAQCGGGSVSALVTCDGTRLAPSIVQPLPQLTELVEPGEGGTCMDFLPLPLSGKRRVAHNWALLLLLQPRACSVLCAYGSMGLLPLLILERPVFIRERADGLYRPITYLVGCRAAESKQSKEHAALLYGAIAVWGRAFLVVAGELHGTALTCHSPCC